MLRMLTCGLVALTLVAGLVMTAEAAKGKKGKGQHGTVKSLSNDGTLTVTVKKKKESEDVTIKLDKEVTVLDEQGQPIESKDQKDKLKEGTAVTLIKNDDNKVTTVRIGGGKKKKKNQ